MASEDLARAQDFAVAAELRATVPIQSEASILVFKKELTNLAAQVAAAEITFFTKVEAVYVACAAFSGTHTEQITSGLRSVVEEMNILSGMCFKH